MPDHRFHEAVNGSPAEGRLMVDGECVSTVVPGRQSLRCCLGRVIQDAPVQTIQIHSGRGLRLCRPGATFVIRLWLIAFVSRLHTSPHIS